ncbi:MAG: hypothetical protein ACRELZ_17045, partial [Candidatus Rokuibacteriota bacterium]
RQDGRGREQEACGTSIGETHGVLRRRRVDIRIAATGTSESKGEANMIPDFHKKTVDSSHELAWGEGTGHAMPGSFLAGSMSLVVRLMTVSPEGSC